MSLVIYSKLLSIKIYLKIANTELASNLGKKISQNTKIMAMINFI